MEDLIKNAATAVADLGNCDVLLYSGDIERGFDDQILDLCLNTNRRENVLLILCSRGGNPDAAYRIARGLQEYYKSFTVLLAGRCKSAGTLIAIGANELVMTDHAELGPIDVQLGKKDELFETASGLTVLNALTELENKAFELFEKTFLKIKVRSEGNVTFKTATHIATELAKGIVAPIMAQIDPIHVGEVSRAMKIGKEYGERLTDASRNLREGALDKLVDDYPSHGFVIDRREAEKLFVKVRRASDLELILLELIRPVVRTPSDEPIFFFMSETGKEKANDFDNKADISEPEDSTGARDREDQANLAGEKSGRQAVLSAVPLAKKTGTRAGLH